MNTVNYADNTLDTLNLVSRYEWLASFGKTKEELIEFVNLETLLETIRNSNAADNPEDGVTLVREDYFAEFIETLYRDWCKYTDNIPSEIAIDWKATADNARKDFISVEFGGVSYLYR